MNSIDILQQCKLEGNLVKLPNIQLERNLYLEVSKKLELIGGKWNRKNAGFVFSNDPTDLLSQIANGENRNLKKEFQFFATPPKLAERLVILSMLDPKDTILEPSAGQGSIVNAVNRLWPEVMVDCYELMDINVSILKKISTVNFLGNDFLKRNKKKKYSNIIANPPFSKNQDIDHIYSMYESLEKNGTLVSVSSKHWETSSNKKETQFRNWLDEKNAEIRPVDAGSFKESGTDIAANIIVIDKK